MVQLRLTSYDQLQPAAISGDQPEPYCDILDHSDSVRV